MEKIINDPIWLIFNLNNLLSKRNTENNKKINTSMGLLSYYIVYIVMIYNIK